MSFRFDRRLTGLVLTLAVVVTLSACGKKRPPVLANPGDAGGSSAADRSSSRRDTQPVETGPDVRAADRRDRPPSCEGDMRCAVATLGVRRDAHSCAGAKSVANGVARLDA